MIYEKHKMNVVFFKVTDAIVFTMSDGGSEYNPWSIKPDRSDS